jgi:DHA1 family tetracycline resistance protein-like MFS transporter
MTRLVDATEQGRLQGSLASLMGLASLIGPALFTAIFAASVGGGGGGGGAVSGSPLLPGAAFLAAALIILAGMVLAWRATRSLSSAA